TLAPLLGTTVYLGSMKAPAQVAAEGAALDGADSRLMLAEMVQDVTEGFTRLVQQMYRQFLGRPAVPGEEQSWVQMLLAGHSEENVLGELLATAAFYSAALARGSKGTQEERYVQGLHEVLLGRSASKAEVSAWLEALPALGTAGMATFLLRSAEYRGRQ